MWRLTRGNSKNDDESGAVSVVVALLLVALLGFGAIAVDVGMLYAERTQLQNASDAAALMVAQKCARNTTDPNCADTSPLAAELANKNAVDGLSSVKSIELDKTSRTVRVTAGAKESRGDPNSVSLFFARVFGLETAEVTADSRVEWGTPSKGRLILPLAIPQCKLNLIPGGAAGSEQVLDFDTGGCGEIPGGFSWIEDGDGKCSVSLAAGLATDSGIWFASSTGASVPSPCTASDVSSLNNQTVLLPLYDVATGNGSSGKYYVKGFAAFHVTGYKFESHSWTSGGNIKNKTLRGYFVKYVSLSEAFELGSAPDYGASVVHLTQ